MASQKASVVGVGVLLMAVQMVCAKTCADSSTNPAAAMYLGRERGGVSERRSEQQQR